MIWINPKLFNLETPMVQPKKPILWSFVIPSLISTAGGIFSNLWNTSSQQKTNDQSMAWQSAENSMNRQFNASEAEKQRNWQSQEWLNQFNLQRDEWYKQQMAQFGLQKQMFDYQAAYNDPSAQLRRLQGAGLNSAALLGGQGSSGLVAASTANFGSAPSPSVPTGGAVSGSAASATPVGSPNILAPHVDIGSIGDFLAQASKAYNESALLRPTIDTLVSQASKDFAEAASKQVLTALSQVELSINNATKDVKIKQAFQDLSLSYVDLTLKRAMGKNYEADTFLKMSERLNELMKYRLSGQQYVQNAFALAHLDETYTNEQKLIKAQANQANSAAFESIQSGKLKIEQTATERDIRQWQVANVKAISEYNFYLKESQKVDSAINAQSANERLMYLRTTLVNEAFKSHLINEATKHQIDLLIAQHEFYAVDEFIKALGAISGLGMAAGVSVGAMSKFQSKPAGPLGPIYSANSSFSY